MIAMRGKGFMNYRTTGQEGEPQKNHATPRTAYPAAQPETRPDD